MEDKVKKITDVEECTFKPSDLKIECNIYADLDDDAMNDAIIRAQKEKLEKENFDNRRGGAKNYYKVEKVEVFKKDVTWTTEDIKELIEIKFKPADFNFMKEADIERIKELLLVELEQNYSTNEKKKTWVTSRLKGWLEVMEDVHLGYIDMEKQRLGIDTNSVKDDENLNGLEEDEAQEKLDNTRSKKKSKLKDMMDLENQEADIYVPKQQNDNLMPEEKIGTENQNENIENPENQIENENSEKSSTPKKENPFLTNKLGAIKVSKIDNFRDGVKEFDESCLTEEEQVELSTLLRSGFGHWNKGKHFNVFIKGLETYGKSDLNNVVMHMKNNTKKDHDQMAFEEVQDYFTIFWENIKELDAGNRIIKRIALGELKKAQFEATNKALQDFVKAYGDNWVDMILPYDIKDKFTKNANAFVEKGNLEDKTNHFTDFHFEPMDDKFVLYAYAKYKSDFDECSESKEKETENGKKIMRTIKFNDMRVHQSVLAYDCFLKILTYKEFKNRADVLVKMLIKKFKVKYPVTIKSLEMYRELSDSESNATKSNISNSDNDSRSNSREPKKEKTNKKNKKKSIKNAQKMDEENQQPKVDIISDFRRQMEEAKASSKNVVEKYSKNTKDLGAIMEEEEEPESGTKKNFAGIEA